MADESSSAGHRPRNALGLIPLVRIFTTQELEASLTAAGIVLDHRWQPGKGKALFLVAVNPG